VLGLTASTGYQFELVAFRGTLNVNAVFGALSNVASGTTTVSTVPVVASVAVSPGTGSMTVGQTLQLTATPKDASGNPLMGQVVTWASSAPAVATVNGSGLVTAVAAGTATITATSGGQSGTAAVTVTTGTGTTSNEPAGYRAFNDQPWNAIGTWQVADNNWYYALRTSTINDAIIQDATAPRSPLNVLEIVFPPTMAANSEPSVHWIVLPSGVKAIYTTWWVKLSPNWTPSPAGGGKITFLHTATGQVYTGFFGSSAPHHLSVNTEWSPYGQLIWDPNVTTTPLWYNQWYHMEWYMQWESAPGAGDGIMRWWVNGVLNGNYTNVSYPNDGGFTQFEFAPTLQNPPPATQYMYVDHAYISTP
jgi:Bacterial Ig-like domain (group 2)